ncbi:mannose-6-phosphate isomerase [Smithella sp. SCADC]|jgi:mannose-6-phosphate isomerase-like protein (cupin superfamily)|nr:mannose-6-phosphate isomerase [Smithella sp. SCADC]KFO68823.1 mannose-6-phosphate isomerase [Smithella sp. SCADC]
MKKVTKCPWGNFEVLLDAPDHKVKRIIVEPGGCLSLQLHHHRSEHWFVVAGKGMAIVDGKKKSLHAGSSIDIPQKSKHRVQNSSDEDLIFIEVQTGEYCGDDDIERFEDKYGRI